jgi:hypothetical protein
LLGRLSGGTREETKMAGSNCVMRVIKNSANYRKLPPEARSYSGVQEIPYILWEPKFSTFFRIARHFSLSRFKHF